MVQIVQQLFIAFVASIREGLADSLQSPMIERNYKSIAINYYCDVNTNKILKRTFYSNLAIAYADKDDFQQALAYDQKAYDIRKRVLGTYSKDMAITYISLAEDYLHFDHQ